MDEFFLFHEVNPIGPDPLGTKGISGLFPESRFRLAPYLRSFSPSQTRLSNQKLTDWIERRQRQCLA